jgi:hypothetical protein
MHVHRSTLNIILRNILRDKIPEKHNKINRPDFIFSPMICFLRVCNSITTKYAVNELNTLPFNLIQQPFKTEVSRNDCIAGNSIIQYD